MFICQLFQLLFLFSINIKTAIFFLFHSDIIFLTFFCVLFFFIKNRFLFYSKKIVSSKNIAHMRKVCSFAIYSLVGFFYFLFLWRMLCCFTYTNTLEMMLPVWFIYELFFASLRYIFMMNIVRNIYRYNYNVENRASKTLSWSHRNPFPMIIV